MTVTEGLMCYYFPTKFVFRFVTASDGLCLGKVTCDEIAAQVGTGTLCRIFPVFPPKITTKIDNISHMYLKDMATAKSKINISKDQKQNKKT